MTTTELEVLICQMASRIAASMVKDMEPSEEESKDFIVNTSVDIAREIAELVIGE